MERFKNSNFNNVWERAAFGGREPNLTYLQRKLTYLQRKLMVVCGYSVGVERYAFNSKMRRQTPMPYLYMIGMTKGHLQDSRSVAMN